MKKFRLLKNAALLTVTGFFLRGLGMIFRIYISGRIGEEGMGLYQLISSVYFLFITLAQSGISVTVTRLCAQKFALGDDRGAAKILKGAVAVALITGMLSCIGMLVLSNAICKLWIADMRAVSSLRVLSLSLPFISVCNVLSAYFIASKNVVFGCTAQILEQLTRMGIVAAAAMYFSRYGLPVLLAAVFAANTLSEAVSCLYLALRLMLQKKRPLKNASSLPGCKRLIIKNAAPVAASRYLASALHTAENMLVPSAMTLFTHSRSVSLSAFGALKGMAMPLLFFPSSFLSAMSTLLVPEITDAHARSDRQTMTRIINRAASFTLVLSIMTAGVFWLFSDSLGRLIYNSTQVSRMLLLLSPIVPFMYLDSICDGLLKGLGLQRKDLIHNCIDSAVRILLIATIVPFFGINGFIAVMAVSNVLISILNLRLLLKVSGVKCNFKGWFLYPFFCALASAFVTKILHPSSATILKTGLGCLLFCSVFLLLMLILNYKSKIYKF